MSSTPKKRPHRQASAKSTPQKRAPPALSDDEAEAHQRRTCTGSGQARTTSPREAPPMESNANWAPESEQVADKLQAAIMEG